jgi:hypothetical protein
VRNKQHNGTEFFETVDEAIASAMLTVIVFAGQSPGTWRCVRPPREL